MNKKEVKRNLRKEIREKKKSQNSLDLSRWSNSIINHIESLPAFKKAGTILLYYSLNDEVRTETLIKRWSKKKKLVLPVINGEDLDLKEYKDELSISNDNRFSIKEPTGSTYNEYDKIELAIIPGMAFDKNGNRLGRGKGYYDRLLKRINAHKIGICFGYQVVDKIPSEEFDCAVNEVWTENGKL